MQHNLTNLNLLIQGLHIKFNLVVAVLNSNSFGTLALLCCEINLLEKNIILIIPNLVNFIRVIRAKWIVPGLTLLLRAHD